MNETVLRPRLTGRRFERHGIPLEVLKDFAVLEEMIIEVAKYKFFKDHPGRQRVPRGFADGLSLKLHAVEEGSAVPVIEVEYDGSNQISLLPIGAMDYVMRAIHAVIHAIGAAERNRAATEYLPERFLAYFDRIGRSLLPDEAIEFPMPGRSEVARLTPETRRKLVNASRSQEYTEEVSIRGSVPEIDQDTLTFHIQLLDGTKVKAPLAEPYYDTILEASQSYRNKARVLIQGVGRFRRDGKLIRMDSIEHVTLLDPLDVPSRLEELSLLKDGWYNGSGKALDPSKLAKFADSFSLYYPDDLPLPYVYPTVEGHLQLEWNLGFKEASLEVNLDNLQSEWHSVDISTREDEIATFDLSTKHGWGLLGQKLRETMTEI